MDPCALWDLMEAHGITQNEAARLAVISSSMLSQIMNGKQVPAGGRAAEIVRCPVPALGGGTGGPRRSGSDGLEEGRAQRRGGKGRRRAGRRHHPHRRTGSLGGPKVEFAYTSGYDSRGRVSVNHIVDERGYGVMLAKPEAGAA